MKKTNNWIKTAIKNFLLFLIKKLDTQEPSAPRIRLSTDSFFKRDITISPVIIVPVTFMCFFVLIILQIGISVQSAIGVFILLLLLFSFVIAYLTSYRKRYLFDTSTNILIAFIFVISLMLFQIFSSILSPIAFPMPAFVVLLSLLVSVRVSLVYIFVMSVVISALTDFSAVLPIIHIAGSLISVVNVKKIRNRNKFIGIGVKSSFIMIAVIGVLFVFNKMTIPEVEINVWFCMLNGFISVLIMLSILPILELLFSKTTNIKLIELADFNNPLLKRLMLEAPGTYHHSLMTASIAEQAADAIGENSLLARTCAYYHDIGKLKNPEYFIENQNRNENPHDSLAPSMSGLVLVSHVKDGVALAKQYKIDQIIIDAINQHHGTSLIQYFYFKAVEKSDDVDERDYRYPGQKPTTKISAILMIADSIEAISRTLQDTSAGKLTEVVQKVINNKFTDGQFENCPITLKDLVKISESMINTLCGIYHARIEYKTKQD